LQACTEGLIEGHIATDIIITISSGWADPKRLVGHLRLPTTQVPGEAQS
jgi:hypothetical protein